jgi:hypothetical protein
MDKGERPADYRSSKSRCGAASPLRILIPVSWMKKQQGTRIAQIDCCDAQAATGLGQFLPPSFSDCHGRTCFNTGRQVTHLLCRF